MVKFNVKLTSLIVALIMLFACAITLTSCSKGEELKVMNVDLNPGVEFILDGKNKVVSVSATNDEGNFIIANASGDFTGLTAEEAVQLFIKIAKDNGFVDISATDDKLEIEISGEDAEDLFNKVEAAVSELDIYIEVQFDAISKDELKKLVGECMKELTSSELSNMSEAELIDKIKASREETKDLLSQELKEIYYNSRADEIIRAKADALKEYIELNASSIQELFLTPINNAYKAISDALTELNKIYSQKFLDENSIYQIAIADFMADKKALLEARLADADASVIAELESAVEIAEADLESAKSEVKDIIDTARGILNSALSSLELAIDKISQFHMDTNAINNKVKNAKNDFEANFKVKFKKHIEKNYWENGLKPQAN